MAIYHVHGQIIGKSRGRSAVGAAAYRSGSKLTEYAKDPETGETYEIIWDYGRKKGVIFSEIFAPDNVCDWVFDREQIWNRVHQSETRKDAQYAREFDIALPKELSREEHQELAREIALNCFVSRGMIADVNIHYDNPGNPHMHIMLTMRELVNLENGTTDFGMKNRAWNSKEVLNETREEIAAIMNKYLERGGHLSRVSHLSFKARDIEIIPGIHIGRAGSRVSYSERTEILAEIVRENAARIRENPELVFSKLSIDNPVFSSRDIAIALNKVLLDSLGLDETSKNTDLPADLEALNPAITIEFNELYTRLISSSKIRLLVEEDLRGRKLYALTKRIELEERFIAKIQDLAQKEEHKITVLLEDIKTNIASGEVTLSMRQKEAVIGVTGGGDIVTVQGFPGAGKTVTMRKIAEIYKSRGKRVFGAAPSSNAALILAKETGIEARNTSLWRKKICAAAGVKFNLGLKSDYYKEPEYRDMRSIFTPSDVLIIDEAGMLELGDIDFLLTQVVKGGAKAILVGDDNQFAAIGMKGAFSKAAEIAECFRLDEIRRQDNPEHAKASYLIGEYRIREALDIYRAGKDIVIKDTAKEAQTSLTRDYTTNYLRDLRYIENLVGTKGIIADYALTQGVKIPTSAICAYTNEKVTLLNKGVRRALKDAGELNGGGVYKIGAKRIELCVGEQIIFERNDSFLGVLNGERGIILKCGTRDSAGYGRLKIAVFKGDGRIAIVDLCTKTFGYNPKTGGAYKRSLSHGYALTGYKLQGSTIDKNFVYFEKDMGYEAFLVAMTRHRAEVKLYGGKEVLERIVAERYEDTDTAITIIDSQNLVRKGKQEARKESDKEGDRDEETWYTGLNIAANRRTNLSFTGDYLHDEELRLSGDKRYEIMREYLQIRRDIREYAASINERRALNEAKYRERNSLTRRRLKEIAKLTNKLGSLVKLRELSAKIIVENYSPAARAEGKALKPGISGEGGANLADQELSQGFREIIVRLNINYDTIMRHAGIGAKIKLGSRGNSITATITYGKLIELVASLEKANPDEIEKILAELGEAFRILCEELEENDAFRAEISRNLANYRENIDKLSEEIANIKYYREKLLPSFIHRIYETRASEVLGAWEDKVREVGLEKALESVKNSLYFVRNENILGKVRGKSFLTIFASDDERKKVKGLINELPGKLHKYSESFLLEADLKLDRDRLEKEAEQLEKDAELQREVTPNRTEEEFILETEGFLFGIREERSREIAEERRRELFVASGREFFYSDKVLKALAAYEFSFQNGENTPEKIREIEVLAERELTFLNPAEEEKRHSPALGPREEGVNTRQVKVKRERTRERKRAKDSTHKKKERNYLSFDEVKNSLSAGNVEAIFRKYAERINPDDKIKKSGRRINCGSLSMELSSGLWIRFSDGSKGNIFSFIALGEGSDLAGALNIAAGYSGEYSGIRRDNFDRNNLAVIKTEREITENLPARSSGEAISLRAKMLPVPKHAEEFNANKHLKFMLKDKSLGGVYPYKTLTGELLGYSVRILDQKEGTKSVLPVSYLSEQDGGQKGWRLKGFTDLHGCKPIYGLEKLEESLAPVLIVEGEKTADSAQKKLPEYNVISWLGGSQAAGRVDWSALKDREVVIWPDNDLPGKKAAQIITDSIDKINGYSGRVGAVNTDKLGLPEKWDLADELPDNLRELKLKEVIKNASRENSARENAYLDGESFKLQEETEREYATLCRAALKRDDAKYYLRYKKIKEGISHEVLDLEGGAYAELLTAVAGSAEFTGVVKTANTVTELRNPLKTPEAIDKLLDTLEKITEGKDREVRADHIYLRYAEEAFAGGNYEKRELFYALLRDSEIIVEAEIGGTLTGVHKEELVREVCLKIRELDMRAEDSFASRSYKEGAYQEVFKEITGDNFYRKLAEKNNSLLNKQREKEREELDKYVKINSLKLDTLKKLDKGFDEEVIYEKLQTLTEKGRDKYLNTSLSRGIDALASEQLGEFKRLKVESVCVEEIIKIMDREREYCRKLCGELGFSGEKTAIPITSLTGSKVGNTVLGAIARPKLTEHIMRDTNYLTTYAKFDSRRIANYLRHAEDHGICADKLFLQCGKHAISEMRKDLALIKDAGEVTKHGLNFHDEKHYLEHVKDHEKHAIYFKSPTVEKHFSALEQRHLEHSSSRGLHLSL